MDDTLYSVSTQRAAQLLHVHESSVKRWCNAETLACSYTPGGHRRIPLAALMQLAQDQGLPCGLLALHPFEAPVWAGVNRAWSEASYGDLVALLYGWLREGTDHLPVALYRFLLDMEFPLNALFDWIITPVLHRVGEAWRAGQLTVGEEHRMTEIIRESLYALRFDLVAPTHDEAAPRPMAIVGCERTGMHDLGAFMVRLLLMKAGWRVVYLGGRVPAEEYAAQQARHGAALVCVSFPPPQALPDALHLVHMLSQLYDGSHPYRLALGGSGLQYGFSFSESPMPFQDLQYFDQMGLFSTWLASFEAKHPGPSILT